MRNQTESNLQAAYAGESQAFMKYINFADKATAEGFPNVGRLFEAIAWAERIHASSHLRALGKLGKTADNLGAAIAGEVYEVEEMYPAFHAVAAMQDEKRAAVSMEYAMEAEKTHADIYAKAKQIVEAGSDMETSDIYVCGVCGYTGEGEPPDICPVCKVKKERFRIF